MISGLQHPNLVKLYGCCAEGNQLLEQAFEALHHRDGDTVIKELSFARSL